MRQPVTESAAVTHLNVERLFEEKTEDGGGDGLAVLAEIEERCQVDEASGWAGTYNRNENVLGDKELSAGLAGDGKPIQQSLEAL